MFQENVIINSIGNMNLENNNIINLRNSPTLTNNENFEFKEANKKIEWKHYEQVASHLKPDIERVWILIQQLDILLLVHNQGHYPLILTKGNDTKKIGNQFQGNLFGHFPFVAKVNKNSEYPEFKKIEWLFFLKNKNYMSIKMELLKVTEDNSTTLLEKVKFETQELFSELNKYFVPNKTQLFSIIEKILENEPINLVIYESGLINGKMEDIWEFITDFSKLSIVAPNNCFPSNINLKKLEKGQKETYFIRTKKELKEFTLELECKEEKPGWNKWLIVSDIYSKNSNFKEGSLFIQLTKINNNLCQLTIIQKNYQAKNAEEFREISKDFKYIIISIKDYFDNFFSHNND
jgi:hypothetical protein